MFWLKPYVANLLRARNLAPWKNSVHMPKIPMTLKPPRRLVPLANPRLWYNGCANRILPLASALRKKSLAANREAAY